MLESFMSAMVNLVIVFVWLLRCTSVSAFEWGVKRGAGRGARRSKAMPPELGKRFFVDDMQRGVRACCLSGVE
jgi:hypothetical protein